MSSREPSRIDSYSGRELQRFDAHSTRDAQVTTHSTRRGHHRDQRDGHREIRGSASADATAEPGREPYEWSTVPRIRGVWLESDQPALFTHWVEMRNNVVRVITGQRDTREFGDDLVEMEVDTRHLFGTARLSLSDLELEEWRVVREDARAMQQRAVNRLEDLASALSEATHRAERYRPATQSTEARAVVLSPAMHLDAKIQELSGKMWSAMVGLDVEAKMAFKLIQERDKREGQKSSRGTRGNTSTDNGSTSMRHIEHSRARGASTDALDGRLVRPRQGGRGDSHATPLMPPTQDRRADGGYSVRRRVVLADETASDPEAGSHVESTADGRRRSRHAFPNGVGGHEGSQTSRHTYGDPPPRRSRTEDRDRDTVDNGHGTSTSGRRSRTYRTDRRGE